VTHRWLRLDGSESDMGEFVADRDFWHPAGRRVVWDLVKPASEKVEKEDAYYYMHNGRRASECAGACELQAQLTVIEAPAWLCVCLATCAGGLHPCYSNTQALQKQPLVCPCCCCCHWLHVQLSVLAAAV
jgi:hypothetical protein